MSRRGDIDVIVVGAGAVGGTLALALARDGFEVAVIEAREPKPWRHEDEVDLRVVGGALDVLQREALAVPVEVLVAVVGAGRHLEDGVAGVEHRREDEGAVALVAQGVDRVVFGEMGHVGFSCVVSVCHADNHDFSFALPRVAWVFTVPSGMASTKAASS